LSIEVMDLKELAEGIILQSVEDLYNDDEKQDSITLFASKDFTICAEMAEMDMPSQVRLLDLVKCMITASARHQARYDVIRRKTQP
jgi:hypothetical protein